MIMHCNQGPDVTLDSVRPLFPFIVLAGSNAPSICKSELTPSASNFEKYLRDCLESFMKAKCIGWLDFFSGSFKFDAAEHLDSPLNADMH